MALNLHVLLYIKDHYGTGGKHDYLFDSLVLKNYSIQGLPQGNELYFPEFKPDYEKVVAGRIAVLQRRRPAGGEEVLMRTANIHLSPLEQLPTSQQLERMARALGRCPDSVNVIAGEFNLVDAGEGRLHVQVSFAASPAVITLDRLFGESAEVVAPGYSRRQFAMESPTPVRASTGC